MTGTTRAISSSAVTRLLPGRVDSPPMSMMSAPSAASFLSLAKSGVGISELSAVGKAVRRDVQNRHHDRARQVDLAARRFPGPLEFLH